MQPAAWEHISLSVCRQPSKRMGPPQPPRPGDYLYIQMSAFQEIPCLPKQARSCGQCTSASQSLGCSFSVRRILGFLSLFKGVFLWTSSLAALPRCSRSFSKASFAHPLLLHNTLASSWRAPQAKLSVCTFPWGSLCKTVPLRKHVFLKGRCGLEILPQVQPPNCYFDASKKKTDQENAVCKATSKADSVLSTKEEALASFDRLHARKSTCSTKQFQMWEQATGWTYTPHGILACQELREHVQPISQSMHDWMHAMCSNGVVNICMYLILDELHGKGLDTWKSFPQYLKLWSLPKTFATYNLLDIFKPSRVESYKKFKRIKCGGQRFFPCMSLSDMTVRHNHWGASVGNAEAM